MGGDHHDVPQSTVEGREGRASSTGGREIDRLPRCRPHVPSQRSVEKQPLEWQVPGICAIAPVTGIAEYRRDLVPQHDPQHQGPDGYA
jgi:hypothetical protein